MLWGNLKTGSALLLVSSSVVGGVRVVRTASAVCFIMAQTLSKKRFKLFLSKQISTFIYRINNIFLTNVLLVGMLEGHTQSDDVFATDCRGDHVILSRLIDLFQQLLIDQIWVSVQR